MAVYYCNFDAATDGTGTAVAPWNNPTSAQAGIARGDTVFTRGVWRGSWVFDPTKGGVSAAAKTRWIGAAADPFTVTGGEKLTGWLDCTVADQPDVGANYLSIKKKTINKSTLVGGNILAVNICENGFQLPICVSRLQTDDTFFVTKPSAMWVGTQTLSGTTIISYSLPSVTDLYTKTQLERGELYLVHGTNRGGKSKFIYDTVAKTMTISTLYSYAGASNPYNNNFAIGNLLPAIKRGEWGSIDNGTTVTIYLWPQDVASLANGIEYSARDVGMDINGTSNIEIAYFKARQTSIGVNKRGNLFNADSTPCSGLYLHHFTSTDMLAFIADDGYAPLYLDRVDDSEISHFDIRRIQGCWGTFFWSCLRLYVHHATMAYCSKAPVRIFTCRDSVWAFHIFWACSRAAHGNTMNGYFSCNNLLWWGIDGEDASGYFTWQASDSLVMGFLSAGGGTSANAGARAIVEQQGPDLTGPGRTYGYKGSALFNSRTVPDAASVRPTLTNSIDLATTDVPNDRWRNMNNIYHGVASATAGELALFDDNDNNIITIGTQTFGPADQLTTLTDMYVAPQLNKYLYKTTALARTKQAKDLTTYIETLKLRFPQFKDWDKDMLGDTFTWTPGPLHIGCGPARNKDAVFGEARKITYSGLSGTLEGGGGGTPSRPVLSSGFKIKVAA